MDFRKDINGLRAWAVLPVVLYHFGIKGFEGGFIGVDIFFVISGFLMTGILFSKSESISEKNGGRKYVLNFYLARARRIIPPLLFLIFILFFFGWFLLTAMDYRQFAKQAASAIIFLSNFLFLNQSSYFDSTSHEKLLLHTWSLSVEWQFYLLLPLVFLLASKIRKDKEFIKKILVICFFISLFLSFLISSEKPVFSFFMLPTRAWEMLAGALVFFAKDSINISDRQKKNIEFIGFFFVATSFYLFDSSDVWPGYNAVLPVLGACLIILVNKSDSIFTSNFISQWLGKISYSLYLWHWPIAAYIYSLGIFEDETVKLYACFSSLLLGWFSWKYVESKSKNNLLRFEKIKQFKYISAFSAFLIIVAVVIHNSDGAKFSFRKYANSSQSLLLEKYENERKNLDDAYLLKCDVYSNFIKYKNMGLDSECTNHIKSGTSILLWGDSHAQALSLGIRSKYKNINFNQITSSACSPSVKNFNKKSGDVYKKSCAEANSLAVSFIKNNNPTLIVIAQRNNHESIDINGIYDFVSKNSGARIILVGPVPQWSPSLPKIYIKDKNFYSKEKYIEDSGLNKSLMITDEVMKNRKMKNIKYISLIDKMCIKNNDNYACQMKIDGTDELLQFDYGHLSIKGSIYVVDQYIDLL